MKAAVAGLALLLLAACSQEPNKETTMSGSIQEVKARYEQQLMDTPGVISLGIGRDAEGNAALIIGIEKESETLRAALPKKLDGYPVEVQTIGPVRVQ